MALTTTQKTEAYQFFIVAFGAATGVEYMNQLNDAYNAGMTTKQIVNVYTTKPQFEALYPRFDTNEQFAERLIENVVGASATAAAKTEAKADVAAALNAGWTKGDVVFQIFTNLAAKAPTDAQWGNTSLMLANKVAVAQYITETLLVNTTDLAKLGSYIASVTEVAATVDAAKLAAQGANGQTFTLTSGADNITGTSGNDTIKAVIDAQDAALGATSAKITTLQATDDIAGGAGTDTLSIISNGNVANTATPLFLKEVEKVLVKDVEATNATTIDLVNATGVTEVINDGSVADVTFNNIGTAAVSAKNLAAAGLDTTFTRGAAPVTADLTINLENLGKAAAVNSATVQTGVVASNDGNNDAVNVTVNATGYVNVTSANVTGTAVAATHTAEKLTINAAGTTIFGAAGAGADITGFNLAKSAQIVVTGAGAVTLNDLAAVVQTVDASANTGGVTLSGTQYNTGTNAAALAAPGLKLTGGSGKDSFTFDGVATAVVDMGAGDDTAIVNAGLTAGASIKGGDGTDTVQLAIADINALEAQNAAGTALRATISGFEKLGVTGDLTGAIHAARAGGYNYVVLNGAVDNADAGPILNESVNISGLTTGATVEFRGIPAGVGGVNEDIAEVVMTDAALATNDVLNIVLNANLAAGTGSQVTAKVGVSGINNINITASDRVNDVTDDANTAATADNGADDGYTVVLSNTANVNTINVAGTSAVTYTLSAGTNAVTLIDASTSTGNFTTSVAAFAGTQRVEIKGSQGVNDITGSGLAFGEKITGGAKGDIITAGAGADDITGNGGRDAFIQGAGASGLTAATVDQISDFGKVTVAATAAEVTAMGTVAAFQAAATARGGDNADIIDFQAVTPTAVATAQSAADDAAINAALELLDGTQTEFAGKVINATIAKGVLTVGGADAAMVDTLAEWVAVANVAAGANGETAAFQFNGNTYIFQQQAVGDELVELTGTTGVAGVVLVGSAVAAAVGDIFVL